MPRAFPPSGRKLLLLGVLAIVGGAWWWEGSPRDPVYRGRRLSEALAHDESPAYKPGQSQANEIVDNLKPVGPTVTYLAYVVEHGKHSAFHTHPLPLEKAPLWLRRWFPGRWGGLSDWSEIDERMNAAELLNGLGAEAAPAFPALVRALESDSPNGELAYEAAWTLQDAGAASWPIVQATLEHGSARARIPLLNEMFVRLELHKGGPSEAEIAPAVAALIKALHDPDPEVRQAGAYGLLDCKGNRENDDRYDAALPALLQVVLDRDTAALWNAMHALSCYEEKAAAIIPRLIESLDDHDPGVRSDAAQLLAFVDKTETRSTARLRAMLEDPDAGCRKSAGETLKSLGVFAPCYPAQIGDK